MIKMNEGQFLEEDLSFLKGYTYVLKLLEVLQTEVYHPTDTYQSVSHFLFLWGRAALPVCVRTNVRVFLTTFSITQIEASLKSVICLMSVGSIHIYYYYLILY